MYVAAQAEDGQVGHAADENCLPCMTAFAEAFVTEKGCSLLLRQLSWLIPRCRRLQTEPYNVSQILTEAAAHYWD